MKVWILTKKTRFNDEQAQNFKEEAKKLGVGIKHVCASDFEIIEPAEFPQKILYKGKPIKIPDALITRISSMSYFSLALVRLLEKMGVFVLNSAKSIETAEDKLKTIQILTIKHLPIPNSILAKFPVNPDFIESKLGYPVILKTVLGAKGEGVLLLENKHQFEDVTKLLHKSTEGKTNLIFQKYIKKSAGKDIRVLVIGNKAVGAAMRKGTKGHFKSNVSAGGSAEHIELTKEMAELAVSASKTLGLQIAGVDLLIDGKNFLIAEVNSTPSLNAFGKIAKINVPKIILKYATEETKKLKKQKQNDRKN